MTKVNFQALQTISLYRLCLQAARRSATRAKAEEMRLLCRLKFRDGSSADHDRSQALLRDGFRELSSFMYYLGVAESRKTGGTKLPYSTPEVAEAAIVLSVEEAAAAAAARLAKLEKARRVPASMVTHKSGGEGTLQANVGESSGAAVAAAASRGDEALSSARSESEAPAAAADSARPRGASPAIRPQLSACACAACGSALPEKAKFCGECGAAALCRGCGTRYSPSAKFCPECGLKRPAPLA